MNNPYQSPDSVDAKPTAQSSRLLFWFSLVVVALGVIVWVSVIGSIVTDIANGWGDNLAVQATVGLVFTLVLGLICVPQYYSVFRRNLRWARIASWISFAGIFVGLTAAIVYPIVEYNYSFSPPGAEFLGAVLYSLVAASFFLNRRLHRDWIEQLQRTPAE